MKRRIFIIASVILACLTLSSLILYRAQNRAGTVWGHIQSGGDRRSYLLYVPASYQPEAQTALVISMHGFASWPANQLDNSLWNKVADREGFIVAYPSGSGFPLRWNTSIQSGVHEDPQVDVTFITDLIDHLLQVYSIDPARIYINGFSNGGGMANLLACKISGRIAAIGTLSGLYFGPDDGCHPERPVPVITFHGTEDPIVPFLGGPSDGFNLPFPNINDWVVGWAQRNGCNLTPEPLPPSGEVSGVHYQECGEGADVIFYVVEGGGHTWPGGGKLPRPIAGYQSFDVNATELIWEFFEAHPLEH